MIDYTIIIPAYNCGKYIGECLESIFKSFDFSYEVIVIDDGSTDNTKEVCENLSNDKLRYIYQDNQGVSAARNHGLDLARGKYILFVDADDRVDSILQDGLIYIEKMESDLHIFSYYSFNESGKKGEYIHPNETVTQKEYLENPDKWIFHYLNAPFAKIFKREVIDKAGLRFDRDLKIGEDLVFNLSYITNVERISISDHLVYAYRIHSESVMNKFYEDLSQKQRELTRKVFHVVDLTEAELNAAKTRYLINTFNYVSNYYYRNQTLQKKEKMTYIANILKDFSEIGKALEINSQHLPIADVLLMKAISKSNLGFWLLHKSVLKVQSMLK